MEKWVQARLQVLHNGWLALVRYLYGTVPHRTLPLALVFAMLGAGVVYANSADAQTGVHQFLTLNDSGSSLDGQRHEVNVSTSLKSSTTNSRSDSEPGNNPGHIAVTVNGQALPVPANGELHRDLTDANGDTLIDISHHDSASGTSSSSVDIELNSTSITTAGGDTSD